MVKERVLAVPDTSIFYCGVAGSNQKYHTERFRGTCKGTSLPAGMGPGK